MLRVYKGLRCRACYRCYMTGFWDRFCLFVPCVLPFSARRYVGFEECDLVSEYWTGPMYLRPAKTWSPFTAYGARQRGRKTAKW